MKHIELKLGIWAAILSAVFAIAWFITFSMQDVIHSVPEWKNLTNYANKFSILRLTYIYPSLLLGLTYLILLSCLHSVVSEEKKIWSLIALSIGIVYSVMAAINYNIQAVAVRASLAAGETGGIEMFLPDNPHSVFGALANSYVYMAISMFFAGFLFEKGKLEQWIRWILFLQMITAVGQVGNTMFNWSTTVFVITSMIWVVGAPLVFILIAVWFKRQK